VRPVLGAAVVMISWGCASSTPPVPSPPAAPAPAASAPLPVAAAPAEGAAPISNRMAPARGDALVRSCGKAATANEMLSCLEGGPDFVAYQAAWPAIAHGSESYAIHGVWLMRVMDAAVKADAELRGQLLRMMKSLQSSSYSDADGEALLAGLRRRQLGDEDIATITRAAGMQPAFATVTQQLLAVSVLLFAGVAQQRNRLD